MGTNTLGEIWVLLVEDDLYARDMMTMLLSRDWRTRVRGEVGDTAGAVKVLREPQSRVDVVLVDSEFPGDANWPFQLAREVRRAAPNPLKIVLTGTRPQAETLTAALEARLDGYVLKDEVGYALAAVVKRVAEGNWLLTPGIHALARQTRLVLPHNALLLDGRRVTTGEFTRREWEVVRLFILFGLTQREIADEWRYQHRSDVGAVVSRVYRKLGLPALLEPDGQDEPEKHFTDPKVLAMFHEARRLEQSGQTVRDKSTLAFHLLTLPLFTRKIFHP